MGTTAVREVRQRLAPPFCFALWAARKATAARRQAAIRALRQPPDSITARLVAQHRRRAAQAAPVRARFLAVLAAVLVAVLQQRMLLQTAALAAATAVQSLAARHQAAAAQAGQSVRPARGRRHAQRTTLGPAKAAVVAVQALLAMLAQADLVKSLAAQALAEGRRSIALGTQAQAAQVGAAWRLSRLTSEGALI